MDNIEFDGDENEVLDVGEIMEDPQAAEDVWLAGKVLAHHSIGAIMFKDVMQELWVSRGCVEIRYAGVNLFTFRFSYTKNRDLVLQSGPWFFDRYMISLNIFDARGDPAMVTLTRVPFWIQVYHLSTAGGTEAMARVMGNSLAGFIGWDRSKASRFGSCFCIRAWVHVDAPLKRGKMLAAGGGAPFKVTFKYEKLRNFCYRCGMMNHVDQYCTFEERAPLPFALGSGVIMIKADGTDRGEWLEKMQEERLIDEMIFNEEVFLH